MCTCISGEPIEDVRGRIRTFRGDGRELFATDMMGAPYAECPGGLCWCLGQYFPLTMGCTQCMLRRKILGGDMSQYRCFQGYYTICCCIRGGSCYEDRCPNLCAFLEGCFCNCVAISASRVYTMEKYNLASDACDYRLIRINNCLQILACVCDLLAIADKNLRKLSMLVDNMADCFYHTVSGCMTAQVAHEVNIREKMGSHHKPSPSAPPAQNAVMMQPMETTATPYEPSSSHQYSQHLSQAGSSSHSYQQVSTQFASQQPYAPQHVAHTGNPVHFA